MWFLENNVDPSWRTNSNLYLALHTADPGEAGGQSTSEADYTGYARVAVAKTSAGWDIVGNQASNAALVQFPQCTGGQQHRNRCVYRHIGHRRRADSLLRGVNLPPAVSNLIQPQFAIGALVITED